MLAYFLVQSRGGQPRELARILQYGNYIEIDEPSTTMLHFYDNRGYVII